MGPSHESISKVGDRAFKNKNIDRKIQSMRQLLEAVQGLEQFGVNDLQLTQNTVLFERLGWLVTEGVLIKTLDNSINTKKRWKLVGELNDELVLSLSQKYAVTT